MRDTSESTLWTLTEQGYGARDDPTRSDPVGGVVWPLSADSDVDQHAEEIPLTLMRDTPRGVEAEATSGTQPLLQHYLRPSGDYHDPNLVESPSKQHAVIGSDEPSLVTGRNRNWRPTWLQPPTVLVFMTLFFALAISLPMLFWYSQKHEGIAKSRPDFVYLWRFGPTAGRSSRNNVSLDSTLGRTLIFNTDSHHRHIRLLVKGGAPGSQIRALDQSFS